MEERLCRSQTDRMLTGVAAGMAEYFDIDPVLVRLLWVLGAVFSGGVLIIVYFIMAIIMPSAPLPAELDPAEPGAADDEASDADDESGETAGAATTAATTAAAIKHRRRRRRARGRGRAGAAAALGVALIVIGGIALLDSIGVFRAFNPWDLWPVILIAMGGAIVYAGRA